MNEFKARVMIGFCGSCVFGGIALINEVAVGPSIGWCLIGFASGFLIDFIASLLP